MVNFSEKAVIKILSVAAIAAILPYVALSYFVFPVADDLSYALQGMDSIWAHYKINYQNWCGRYISNFAVLLNGFITPDILLYRFYPVTLIFILLICIYFLFKKLSGSAQIKLPVLLFSLLFLSVYFNIMPHLAEGLYWFTGSVTYVLPAFLVLIYTLLSILYDKMSFIGSRFFHLALLVILILLIIGFNEALMFLFVSAHLVVFLIALKKENRNKYTYLFLAVVCVAASLIVVLAPGNENRSDFFPQKHQFFHSIVFSAAQTIRFFMKWVLSLPLLLFSLLYLPYAKRLNNSFSVTGLSSLNPLFIIGCLLLIIFCAVFPPYWATGMLGQYRTLNTVLIVFLLTWMLFLHYISEKYIDNTMLEVLNRKKVNITLISFFLLSLFFTGNGGVAVYDLFSGKAFGFKWEQEDRQETLIGAKAKGDENPAVYMLHYKPESIYILDITPDSAHWVNYSYASYYGLNSVKGK